MFKYNPRTLNRYFTCTRCEQHFKSREERRDVLGEGASERTRHVCNCGLTLGFTFPEDALEKNQPPEGAPTGPRAMQTQPSSSRKVQPQFMDPEQMAMAPQVPHVMKSQAMQDQWRAVSSPGPAQHPSTAAELVKFTISGPSNSREPPSPSSMSSSSSKTLAPDSPLGRSSPKEACEAAEYLIPDLYLDEAVVYDQESTTGYQEETASNDAEAGTSFAASPALLPSLAIWNIGTSPSVPEPPASPSWASTISLRPNSFPDQVYVGGVRVISRFAEFFARQRAVRQWEAYLAQMGDDDDLFYEEVLVV